MAGEYDYGEACPVSMAASVLSERWTLQIVREMFLGSTKFSQFQKYMPNISPSLLRNRLRTLEDHGIIMRRKTATQGRYDYYLTASGKALGPLLTEFGKWGMRFANSGMTDKANTVYGLMRDLGGALDVDELPGCDVVVQFDFADNPENPKQYINVHNGQAEVCSQNLGFEIDVYINTTVKVMTKVWYGELPMQQAIDEGEMKLLGNVELTRSVTRWLRISSFTGDNPRFVAPDHE